MYVVRGNIAECTVFTPPATMQPERPLFRTEAAAANRGTWLGEIILIRPLSFRLITVATCILTLLLAALLRYGTYTQRNTVEGHLIPDKGLIRTYPPQVAIVVEKHVSEGQQVNRGDTLFVLSTERQNSSKQETYATIGLQVELRQQSLQSELKKTQQLQQEEQQGSAQKIALIKAELNKLASQISGQQLRVQLSEENVARYRNLFAQHYISKEMLQQKQIDLLDQRNRLQSLERDHIISKRQLASEQHALSALVLQQQNQRAQMDRSLSQSQQEFIENEAKRQLTVKAFSDGIATGVTAELGQTVDTGKPLLSLIPRDAQLLAELYVPSRAIGFIKPGSPVSLRYQAYPYQKFGHATGTIATISKTALSANDLNLTFSPGSRSNTTEPYYRIIVNLSKQSMMTYNLSRPLQAGMLLEADIALDTRRLYEWALEPLYSLTKKR